MRIVVAVGGNAIVKAGQAGTWEEQLANVQEIAAAVLALRAQGHEVVLTHGNGPQVGALLLQQALGEGEAAAAAAGRADRGDPGRDRLPARERVRRAWIPTRAGRRAAHARARRRRRRGLREPDQARRPVLQRGGGQAPRRDARLGRRAGRRPRLAPRRAQPAPAGGARPRARGGAARARHRRDLLRRRRDPGRAARRRGRRRRGRDRQGPLLRAAGAAGSAPTCSCCSPACRACRWTSGRAGSARSTA